MRKLTNTNFVFDVKLLAKLEGPNLPYDPVRI